MCLMRKEGREGPDGLRWWLLGDASVIRSILPQVETISGACNREGPAEIDAVTEKSSIPRMDQAQGNGPMRLARLGWGR